MSKVPVQKGQIESAPSNGTTEKMLNDTARAREQLRRNEMIKDYQTPKFHTPKQ